MLCSSLRGTHHECERRTLCRHQQVSQWGCLLQFYPKNILGVYNISTISYKIRSEKVLEPRKCNCWVESRWRAWPDNHWTRRRGVLSCRSCQPERRWRLRRGAPLPDCSCAETKQQCWSYYFWSRLQMHMVNQNTSPSHPLICDVISSCSNSFCFRTAAHFAWNGNNNNNKRSTELWVYKEWDVQRFRGRRAWRVVCRLDRRVTRQCVAQLPSKG